MSTKYPHYTLPRKIKFDDTVIRATVIVHQTRYDNLMLILEANPTEAGTITERFTPETRKDGKYGLVITGMSLRILNLLKKKDFIYLHHYLLTSNGLRIEFWAKETMAPQSLSISVRDGNYQSGEERYTGLVEMRCESKFLDDTVTGIKMSWPSIGSVEQEKASKFAQALNLGLILMEDCQKFVKPATIEAV